MGNINVRFYTRQNSRNNFILKEQPSSQNKTPSNAHEGMELLHTRCFLCGYYTDFFKMTSSYGASVNDTTVRPDVSVVSNCMRVFSRFCIAVPGGVSI